MTNECNNNELLPGESLNEKKPSQASQKYSLLKPGTISTSLNNNVIVQSWTWPDIDITSEGSVVARINNFEATILGYYVGSSKYCCAFFGGLYEELGGKYQNDCTYVTFRRSPTEAIVARNLGLVIRPNETHVLCGYWFPAGGQAEANRWYDNIYETLDTSMGGRGKNHPNRIPLEC
ncbi:MAG: hypothetical protein HQ521_11530 [Bacteroidetes bacterium]|nr:hypothetical protein [Bacteroidota bacterium]